MNKPYAFSAIILSTTLEEKKELQPLSWNSYLR